MAEQSTRARPRSTIARYTKARVSVTRGPDRGAVVEAAGTPIRIGTDPDNDLVLGDDTVSRHHCELEMTGDGLRVRDRGSTNGVMSGGTRLYDAVLPREATLRLGETEICV